MRSFLELAKARKTTYEFSTESVDGRNLALILEAGRWAPSCTNTQPWSFIVIKNREHIERLMQTANYGDFHGTPHLMVALVLRAELCLGKHRVCFRSKASGTYDSYMSVAMAGLQMLLQAEEAHIDSCLLTPDPAKVKRLLHIKQEDAVPLLIGFGHMKPGSFQKKRERRPLKDQLYHEYFGKN
ncbi:nitroreductase family protein [Candidatus Woesearchaeota archaeon]|nr:nitroreductase family protein [Candidatus Woesearchaeota archaeon]